MASELKVDKISGVASAGAVLVTAEGGTTTTSLTQGLVKGWANFSMSGTPAFRDSINMASITGDGTLNYTNSFSNVNYAFSGMSSLDDGTNDFNIGIIGPDRDFYSLTTSTIRLNFSYNSGASSNKFDNGLNGTMLSGDLA
jgi:hypothetical protein